MNIKIKILYFLYINTYNKAFKFDILMFIDNLMIKYKKQVK